MTFEEAKIQQIELDAAVKTTSEALQVFPKTGIGLVPDAVRATPEYRTAKKAFEVAFHALRDFNQTFVKQFREELREERRVRMEALMAANLLQEASNRGQAGSGESAH